LPVKTSTMIPKDMIFKVNEEIGNLTLNSAKSGDVIIKNVLGTGADVVVTGDIVKFDI